MAVRRGLSPVATRAALLGAISLFLSTALCAQTARIIFDDVPTVEGLEHVRSGDGSDGEGDLVDCGPEADERRAMRSRGSADDDTPDAFLYFNLQCCASQAEIDLKSAASVTVAAVVFDDRGLNGSLVALEYSNRLALASGDLENVFSRHPFLHELEGSETWVVLTWVLRDAGFASRQHGVADFRLRGIAPGGGIARMCVDQVEVTAGAPAANCPSGLTVTVDEATGDVELQWSTTGDVERLRVLRNGRAVAVLPGGSQSYSEPPGPGHFVYEVVALPSGDVCEPLRVEAFVFPPRSGCGCPDPDANGDGVIDFGDLAFVTSNVGLALGDAAYTLRADVDRNRTVDMSDVLLVLEHLRDAPPPPSLERELLLGATVEGFDAPGPLVLITSPYANGSGAPEEDPKSLLFHGALLTIAEGKFGRTLVQIDPRTGEGQQLSLKGDVEDLNGVPAFSSPTGIDFSGEFVWVSNRSLPLGGREAGTVAVLDPRSGFPVDGPTMTGIFVGNEDAVDIGPTTGFLEDTAGLAPGGSGPDGTATGDNALYFQTNSRRATGDGAERSASVTAVDFDSGLYRVASLDAEDGLPGPIAFRDGGGLSALRPPEMVRLEAEGGRIRGNGISPSADGQRLVTLGAGDDDRVLFEVTDLPAGGDYVVRVSARLPEGVAFSRLRLEAVERQTALERRLRAGSLPGKLGADLRTVALGRLTLRGGAVGNNLILRIPEAGIEIDALEFEGPVAGRLYAATRDPGTIRVYGLGITGAAGSSGTLYRGILERVIGTCAVEAGPGSAFLIDPVALEISDLDGTEALYVLDGARAVLGKIALDDDEFEPGLPECYATSLGGEVLTGFALAPDVGGVPGLWIASRGPPGPESGGPEPAAGGAGGGNGKTSSGGLHAFRGIKTLFIDRQASDIVEPLGILDERTLVVKATLIDGTTRDLNSLARVSSLDRDVVVEIGRMTIRARTSSGVARVRAQVGRFSAEERVCVSPAGFPWRAHVPPLHRTRPIPAPDSTVRIFPDRVSYSEEFGVDVNALPLPVGTAQNFTAVLVDGHGRVSGLDVDWTVNSQASNAIDTDGVFTASAPEPAALAGFDERGDGLAVTAEIASVEASEPLTVFDASGFGSARAAVLKVFPPDVLLAPGSRLRMVAVLLDTNGIPRTVSPKWFSDGLPIDEETGLLVAEYRGETVDETFTVVCRDPLSGLSAATTVTVLYSETTGMATLEDAQSFFLGQSLFDGALRDLLEAARDDAGLDTLEVTRANAGNALLTEELADLNILIGSIAASFKLDYRANLIFSSEEIVQLALDPSSRGALITVKLRLADVRSALFKNLRVRSRTNILAFLLAIIGLDNPETEDLSPRNIEVAEDDLEELANSIVTVTLRMDLTTGTFSLVEGNWTTPGGQAMHRYLADRVAQKIALEESLLTPFAREFADLLNQILLGEGGALKLAIDLFCAAVGRAVSSVFGPVIGEAAEYACKQGLTALAGLVIGRIVQIILDLFADTVDLDRTLRGPMEDSVVQPTIEFLGDRMRTSGILKKLSDGYASLTFADDLGRMANLRFGAGAPAGAGIALAGSTIPESLGELRRMSSSFAEFRHRGILSYEEETGIQLEGLGQPDLPSGLPTGDAAVGVSANVSDGLSSLFRVGGSTAYKKEGERRGAVALEVIESKTSASDGDGNDVTLSAFCVSAPYFELRDGASPGDLVGRAHLLLEVAVEGDLSYAVYADAFAPLSISRNEREVTIDVTSAEATVLAPADGDLPFAAEIRDLLATSPSLENLQGFLTGTLDARLPLRIEYPARLPVAGLGALELDLVGNDTDPGFEDDFLAVSFVENAGAGALTAVFFKRGDCDGSGRVDLTDAHRVLSGLFLDSEPFCDTACDADNSGDVTLTDAVYLLRWLFDGRDPPPPPFPLCGWESNALGCAGGSHGCL